MKTIVIITNHAGFSKFNEPYYQWLRSNGWYVVNVAPGIGVGEVDKQITLPIKRNPFSLQNILLLPKIRKYIKAYRCSIIHCHTPVGGLLGRLSAIGLNDVKVIYTAHGFHFYKNASLVAWLIYYPIEKILSKYTDYLITTNEEDYILAKNKFKHPEVRKIPGVGVHLEKYFPVTKFKKNILRKQNHYTEKDFILVYVAQFINRKNHIFLVNSFKSLVKKIPEIKIILVGEGDTYKLIKRIVNRKGYSNYFNFLGYRTDLYKIYPMADLIISVSKQEGLPVNILEGMAVGLPVVCSNIRGHNDIVKDGRNGYRYSVEDKISFVEKVSEVKNNLELANTFSLNNVNDIKRYSVENCVNYMANLYNEVDRY